MERIVSDDGSPSLVSARYGQGYRSRYGARSESWHVFVAGSGVASRLSVGLPTTVLEIGLGTARNLGATAAVAFAFDAPLHYVAIEHDLVSADDWARLEPDALGPRAFRTALLAARSSWAATLGARHVLSVGPVTLEVLVDDARDAAWPHDVDAVYLDGFSPSVNPELWTDELLARIAAHLADGGTVASYCVQGRVRRALERAGLRVRKRSGPPGGKREVLWAQRPRGPVPIPPGPSSSPPTADAPPARVQGPDRALGATRDLAGVRLAVVGAGVAGRSLALAASRAGADVTVVDASDGSDGASGVPAALVNPYRGRSGRATDDDLAGAERTWAWAADLAGAGYDAGAHPTGVVRLADDPRRAAAWRARPGTEPFGPDEAPAPGRWRAPHGGIVVPMGGWIDTRRWLAALRAAAAERGVRERLGTTVTSLAPAAGGTWRLRSDRDSAGADDETFDLVALCLGASPPGALPHLAVTAVPGTVAMVAGHLPGRPLAGVVQAAPIGSPTRYGLDASRAWFAVAGGHVERADAEAGADELLTRLERNLPDALPAGAPVARGRSVHGRWHGRRARGPDPRPQVEPLDRGVWWFGSFAGRGFLRAALEAERLVGRWSLGSR